MSVEELARLLLRKDVTGAVVIDKKGKLLGVVTEGGPYRKGEEPPPSHGSFPLRFRYLPWNIGTFQRRTAQNGSYKGE